MERNIYEYKGLKFKSDLYTGIDPINFEYGYEGILKALHPNIQWFYNKEDDWHGDWFAVGKKDNIWYFQKGSFGSCSGCDWYEGLQDYNDAKKLIDSIDIIIKIGTKEEAIIYLKKEIKNLWDSANHVIEKLIEHIEESDKK